MASYTIEDIELIRRRSGISYQEAVALLDYHNGNVARALIDLERNGRILPEQEQRAPEQKRVPENKGGFKGLLQKLYGIRVKITKGQATIANLSSLFWGIAFLVSPWTVIGGAIAAMALGYKIGVDRNDPNFTDSAASLERTVRNAAQNMRNTADDIARSVRQSMQENKPEAKPAEDQEQHTAPEMDRSYYTGNPAATTYRTVYTGSAPTIQVPVKVESTDGDVSFHTEDDGHNSATIG